jgi:hypothetical protein
VNADAFLDLVAQIETWEDTWAPTGRPDTELDAAMRAEPFYEIIRDQRLEVPVRRLCRKMTPNHRKWLWAKIKTRLAALVTRGSPREVAGRLQPGEWQIKIPAAPCGWLNANASLDRNVASRLRSQWRHHVYLIALGQRKQLPQGLEYVKVDLQFQVKTYGLRDNANLHPTAKPIVDAFGPSRTYRAKNKLVHEPGLGVYVGDDPSHMAAGGAFLDWFDEEYRGPLDGIVWMRIIDLSPRNPN